MKSFEHSIPVPHFFKRAAKIVKEVKENGANLKSLVYEEKRVQEIKRIYALTTETLQHSRQIDFLLKRTQLLEKEPRFDPWLARVLINQLLWGKGRLPGESKPIKTVLAYEQMLKGHFKDACEEEQNEKKIKKPRYVRINLLKTSISDAIALFKEEGRVYVECGKKDYAGFLQRVATLGKDEFMSDLHIEGLLIFPSGTVFHRHRAYLNGSIVLQDKASCLPAQLLNPPPNATVLDMCAAPGMKTSHLAANMKNKGLIYAVDINAKRFADMKKLINQLGVSCVKLINKDVLSLTQEDCPGVEYILVDPTCSGSGIVDRLDFDYQNTQTMEERLKKLAGLQILMLKHALMRFPSAKRVVYSTCSLNPEENEAVIQDVLAKCTSFKLVPIGPALKSRWSSFGSPEFVGIGKKCLYAKPEVDQTNGFFVAVLERVADDKRQDVLKKKRDKKFEAGVVPHGKNNETKENDATEERKRKHFEPVSSVENVFAESDVESKNVTQKQRKNKKMKSAATEDWTVTNFDTGKNMKKLANLETAPLFEDEAIKNDLNSSRKRRKSLNNFEEKIMKIISSFEKQEVIIRAACEEELENEIKNGKRPSAKKKMSEKEDENSSNEIEEQTPKKKQKI